MNADVVVVTALIEERDALLGVGDQSEVSWEKGLDRDGFPWHRGKFLCADGVPLNIVVACAGEQGEAAATRCAERLRHQFSPRLIAMCGICGGDRDRTRLGDVIFVSRSFRYDAGKHFEDVLGDGTAQVRFEPDGDSIALPSQAAIEIEEFIRRPWEKGADANRPLSIEFQSRWLLRAMARADREDASPRYAHPDRLRRCPDWPRALQGLVESGIVVQRQGEFCLSEEGLNAGYADLQAYPEEIVEPPFRIHLGGMATGSSVIATSGIFRRLRQQCRRALALDKEAYAVAALASSAGLPWLIVKGVSDYSDPTKDDRFHLFAARASAKVLLRYLIDRTGTPDARSESSASAAPETESFAKDDVALLLDASMLALLYQLQTIATTDWSDREIDAALELVIKAFRTGQCDDIEKIKAVNERLYRKLDDEWKPLVRSLAKSIRLGSAFDRDLSGEILALVPARHRSLVERYLRLVAAGYDVRLIAELIDGPDGDPMVAVAIGLAGTALAPAPGLVTAILRRLQTTASPLIRRVAIRTLARHSLDRPEVKSALLDLLIEADCDGRTEVLSALVREFDRDSELRSFLLLRVRNDPALIETMTAVIATAIPTSEFAYAFLVNCVGLGKDRLARSAIISLGVGMEQRPATRALLETWEKAGATDVIRSSAKYVLDRAHRIEADRVQKET